MIIVITLLVSLIIVFIYLFVRVELEYNIGKKRIPTFTIDNPPPLPAKKMSFDRRLAAKELASLSISDGVAYADKLKISVTEFPVFSGYLREEVQKLK